METAKQRKAKATPETVFEFAKNFTRPNGQGYNYPTLREVAAHFGVPMVHIEEVCTSYHGKGYLGIAVGMGGNGGAYAFKTRKEQLVEAYDEAPEE